MKFEDVMIGFREGRLTQASYQKYSDTLIELRIESVEGSIFDGDRELRRYVNHEHTELTANFQKNDLEADWKVEHDIFTQVFDQVVIDLALPKTDAKHEVLTYRFRTVPDTIRTIWKNRPMLQFDQIRSICVYHVDGMQVLFKEEIAKVYGEAKVNEI